MRATIPGKTSDILFTTVLAAVGLALGLGFALLTRVYRAIAGSNNRWQRPGRSPRATRS